MLNVKYPNTYLIQINVIFFFLPLIKKIRKLHIRVFRRVAQDHTAGNMCWLPSKAIDFSGLKSVSKEVWPSIVEIKNGYIHSFFPLLPHVQPVTTRNTRTCGLIF